MENIIAIIITLLLINLILIIGLGLFIEQKFYELKGNKMIVVISDFNKVVALLEMSNQSFFEKGDLWNK